MPKVITYGCSQCGTEVLVTGTMSSNLSPIYCCGMEVTEISSYEEKFEEQPAGLAGMGEIPGEKVQKNDSKPERSRKKKPVSKASAKAVSKKKTPVSGKKKSARKTTAAK